QLSGITGKLRNRISKKRIIVLCADNGVVEEGVSCTPQTVTASQAVNMTKHLTGMSSMAKHFGCEVEVVDVGICTPYDCPLILNRRIKNGTENLYKEPAMTRQEALDAIGAGIERAIAAGEDEVSVIGVGEMGIGNTTTSSAVLSVLTGLNAEQVTGRGGGLTDQDFQKKKDVIDGAIALHKPKPDDPVDVLSKVGGLDLAAMCGVFLGAAYKRIPVVIDGFISVVAALCAARLCPEVKDFLFPSHASKELGYQLAMNELGMNPYLLLNMRLGEGSGCPLAFEILDAACALMNGMATFDGAGINDEYLTEIRKQEF
nr:nicotinate-nucleotide--dimethylbenzimidazole phosphoribosyltransferase [Lachnospiraceae bacterium]